MSARSIQLYFHYELFSAFSITINTYESMDRGNQLWNHFFHSSVQRNSARVLCCYDTLTRFEVYTKPTGKSKRKSNQDKAWASLSSSWAVETAQMKALVARVFVEQSVSQSVSERSVRKKIFGAISSDAIRILQQNTDFFLCIPEKSYCISWWYCQASFVLWLSCSICQKKADWNMRENLQMFCVFSTLYSSFGAIRPSERGSLPASLILLIIFFSKYGQELWVNILQ